MLRVIQELPKSCFLVEMMRSYILVPLLHDFTVLDDVISIQTVYATSILKLDEYSIKVFSK